MNVKGAPTRLYLSRAWRCCAELGGRTERDGASLLLLEYLYSINLTAAQAGQVLALTGKPVLRRAMRADRVRSKE